jgi:hypothetical protein
MVTPRPQGWWELLARNPDGGSGPTAGATRKTILQEA